MEYIFITKMENKKYINIDTIEKKLTRIVGLRGVRRKVALSTAKANLYNYLKSLNYDNVTRGFLSSFFSEDVNPRTRRKVLQVIVNELEKEGKIREEYKTKTITFFRNCQLFSQDYGSYSVMMKRNSYKPKHLRGVYSMSRLSIRKATQKFKIKVYTVL